MFNQVRRQALIALSLMAFLVFSAAAAEARSTHGSDRTVQGAVAGAAIGTVTQVIRGRTSGREILKGAALGGVIGAGVGAYSDYKQEKSARERAERRADYYQYSRGGYGYNNYRGNYYGNGRAYRARNLRYSGDFSNAPYYYQNGRGRGGKHRCN
jgi:uncharacterized membrane protein YebE (DUF533 family)